MSMRIWAGSRRRCLSGPAGLLACTVAVAAALFAARLAAAQAIQVQFAPRTVTASGVSPGSEVLFFGDLKVPATYNFHIKQCRFVATAGADGKVTFGADDEIPVTSVWVVADLRTGKVVVATPRQRGVRISAGKKSFVTSNSESFSFERSFLDLVYVHAGQGAWIWHAADGDIGDADAANGSCTVDIARAERIAGAAALKVFSPGGTIVAIDFVTLDVLVEDVEMLVARGRQ